MGSRCIICPSGISQNHGAAGAETIREVLVQRRRNSLPWRKRLEYHLGNAESGVSWRSNPRLPLEKMLVCEMSPSCSGLITEEDVAVI